MTKLLGKLCEIVESHVSKSPAPQTYTLKPTADIVAAAVKIVSSGRVSLQHFIGQSSVRVKYVKTVSEPDSISDDSAFAAAFDHRADVPVKVAKTKARNVTRRRRRRRRCTSGQVPGRFGEHTLRTCRRKVDSSTTRPRTVAADTSRSSRFAHML